MATTYATAFSFIGSTKRLHGYFGYGKGRDWGSAAKKWTLGVLVATAFALTLVLAWAGVLAWYSVITIGTVFFFWIVIPWRVIRRNQRRNRHLQEQQRDIAAQQLAAQQALVQGFAAQQAQNSRPDHA